MAKRDDITIVQGATFIKRTRWYGGGKITREIEAITVGAPTSIKVTGHGLVAGEKTPVYIDHVQGAFSLNSDDENVATYVDADNFTVETHTRNEVYVPDTGDLVYHLPKDLTNWTARMDIREDATDETPLVSLASPADISFALTIAEITSVIAADVTAALDFDGGVYDLFLIDPDEAVTRLLYGDVAFERTVTRD